MEKIKKIFLVLVILIFPFLAIQLFLSTSDNPVFSSPTQLEIYTVVGYFIISLIANALAIVLLMQKSKLKKILFKTTLLTLLYFVADIIGALFCYQIMDQNFELYLLVVLILTSASFYWIYSKEISNKNLLIIKSIFFGILRNPYWFLAAIPYTLYCLSTYFNF